MPSSVNTILHQLHSYGFQFCLYATYQYINSSSYCLFYYLFNSQVKRFQQHINRVAKMQTTHKHNTEYDHIPQNHLHTHHNHHPWSSLVLPVQTTSIPLPDHNDRTMQFNNANRCYILQQK